MGPIGIAGMRGEHRIRRTVAIHQMDADHQTVYSPASSHTAAAQAVQQECLRHTITDTFGRHSAHSLRASLHRQSCLQRLRARFR